MKKLILQFILYFPILLLGQTQSGLYISNFELNNRAEKWCWAINQDADNLMLLGVANGVVIFDGLNQNLIKLPFTPLSIEKNVGDDSFWISGYKKIGMLVRNGYSNYEYRAINEIDDNSFSKIITHKGITYVLSSSIILSFNSETQQLIDSIEIEDVTINETFILNDQLFFIVDYFLYTIENGKLIENLSADFPVDEFAYTVSLNDNTVILGTNENTYYTFNGKSFKTKSIKTSAFFDNNMVVEGQLYNDSLMLLSSLAGGIALVDINKREVIKQVSYFNGLADDEIRTFFIDNQNAIWASHEFGISRLDFNIGIENFSFYPGLKGHPIAVSSFNDQLYVASSDGLFLLSEIKDYNEFTVSVNVPVNVTVEFPVEQTEKEAVDQQSTEDDDNNRGIFGFLSKRNKSTTDKSESKTQSTQKESYQKKVVRKSKIKKIKKRSLKSVSHYFKLVDGMTDKCTQLVPYQNYLLVAGNNGLYAVSGKKSEKILSAYINDIYYSANFKEAYICTNNGIYKVFRQKGKWELDHFAQTTSINILSIAFEDNNQWALGLDNMMVRAELIGKDIKILQKIEMDEAAGMTFFVKRIEGKTRVFTTNATWTFTSDGELELENESKEHSYVISTQTNYTWKYEDDNWKVFANDNSQISNNQLSKLGLYKELRYIDVNAAGEIWLINEANEVIKINNSNYSVQKPEIQLMEVKSSMNYFTKVSEINLSPSDNNLLIHNSSPFYLKQNGVLFRHKLDGIHSNWEPWSANPVVQIPFIPPGTFNLKIQAMDSFGNIVELNSIDLQVSKPFTQSAVFVFIIILLVIAGAWLFFRIRLIKLKRDKEILEQKVKERTKTIEDQKSHIEKQHDEITQSIRYAKRIQTAMLPHDEIIEAMIPNHFILFMPRDIVSGDFYFFKPVGNKMVFVAADCTGHGVPGGFMSMLGISFLGEITSQVKDPTASEILNHLREKIKLTLGQTDTGSTQKDGMDLSICVIDAENDQIQYSGAFNSLYIIRNKELEIVKADRQPVSVYFKEHEFTNHIIDVKKGDVYYMFSDGFQDQIGGPKQRKFMTKNFKKLLIDNHQLSMVKQKELLHKTITDWQGDSMQVDDILVIGFQV
ncbi:MAG: SpoIIE family protein phosphatase [Salinivirgaceae bacterium]|nr:SpoIIE family protein phosphatase [Salinivirgaceae bacterium]